MKKRILIIVFGTVWLTAFSQQAFTIDDAWKYAVEHNVNVQKAKIDQTIAAQKVKETTGIGLPQVDIQGTYNYFLNVPVQLLPAEIVGGEPGTYVPVQFGQKQSASGGVTLSQLLFNGSYLVGLQAAKAYRETAALVEEKTELSVKEGILLAYTGVLVTGENIKTLEENRKVAEKALSDTKKTYEIGVIELQNVEQQEYSYKSLVANLDNLERTEQKLLMALKYLMGHPLDQSITLTSTLDELVKRNEQLFTIETAQDVSDHIDYRLSRNAVTLSELKLKLEKSRYLPTLAGFLNSSYSGNSNKFSFLRDELDVFNTSLLGLQLDVPVFNGFQRKWKTEQAKLDLKKAQLDLEDTERTLKNRTYQASLDYENAYNSYRNAQELIVLSSSIYSKQQIKFREGMGTSFELQQAETQLYGAQAQYYQAALSLIQAKTKLNEALGNL